MKKVFVFIIVLSVMPMVTLFSQITRKQADEIASKYIEKEINGDYWLYVNNNLDDKNITSDTDITGCDINVQDVSVTNNAKLILDAAGEVTVNGEFEIGLGSQLEINVP